MNTNQQQTAQTVWKLAGVMFLATLLAVSIVALSGCKDKNAPEETPPPSPSGQSGQSQPTQPEHWVPSSRHARPTILYSRGWHESARYSC